MAIKRREFLKTAGSAIAGAAVGSAVSFGIAEAKKRTVGSTFEGYHVNTNGPARMKLSFEPYELQLRHTFTVASYSRTTTPDVQVRIEYDGFTGYGEASMPPYLGQSVESVTAFLRKVDL